MNKKKIITISRQYGSGGREVAERLAKKMQVRCFDRQIVYLAAEKMGNEDLDVEALLNDSHKVPNSIGFMGVDLSFGLGTGIVPAYNQTYLEQAAIIRKIAEKGSAVFLGRCADAILKDRADCYHFYCYADDEYRESRAKNVYGNQTLKDIDKENKVRERYYNYYTGRTWAEPTNYDLMINIGKSGIEQAVEIIWNYIENK